MKPIDDEAPLPPHLRRLLDEQVAYYTARAPEYDATYGTVTGQDGERVDRRIAAVLDALAPYGDVLEVACGTGRWTAPLARRAQTVLAIDAAEPALAIARARVGGLEHVLLSREDALTWDSGSRRFDEVLMAFWLSHVPHSLWTAFLSRTASWLNPRGRLVIVDEHRSLDGHEVWAEADVARRTLHDGSSFRIVKTYVTPGRLLPSLALAGLKASSLAYDRDWVIATAITGR